jgi:chemotaxis protein methyltransferase WspC
MSTHDPKRTVEALLAERIGLDPQTVGNAAIRRALHARMSALGLGDHDTYLRQLARCEDEQQELVEEIVIPESWFFRDERPFDALRRYAARFAGAIAMPGPPLRLLSIPCGCGEEPYSIAIALLEIGLAPRSFQIDAVDISARHLATAERACYRANSFRGVDLTFRDHYFSRDDSAHAFVLDLSVRSNVRFIRGNLLDPQLLSGSPPYNVIFCRNVLIYFDTIARRRALCTLDRLLRRDGILFVGHAERLAIDDLRFEPYGEHASFALRHVEPGVRESPTLGAVPTPAAVPSRFDHSEKAFAPESLVLLPESSATLVAEARVLADQGRSDEAVAHCEAALARFGPSASAYFLLGLVRQSTGRLAEAEMCLRKATYLEPGHEEALVALALIARRRGDPRTAAAYDRRAERARAKRGKP